MKDYFKRPAIMEIIDHINSENKLKILFTKKPLEPLNIDKYRTIKTNSSLLLKTSEKVQLNNSEWLINNCENPTKYINEKSGLKGDTALLEACFRNHEKLILMLLDNGSDPNISNFGGVIPIMPLISHNNKKLVELFLPLTNLNYLFINKNNLAHLCTKKTFYFDIISNVEYISMIKLIFNNLKKYIDVKNNYGYTPLDLFTLELKNWN